MNKGISLLVNGLGCAFTALGQSCPGGLAPYSDAVSGWQPGAALTIYIVSNSTSGTFSTDDINAIETAFQSGTVISGQT